MDTKSTIKALIAKKPTAVRQASEMLGNTGAPPRNMIELKRQILRRLLARMRELDLN